MRYSPGRSTRSSFPILSGDPLVQLVQAFARSTADSANEPIADLELRAVDGEDWLGP